MSARLSALEKRRDSLLEQLGELEAELENIEREIAELTGDTRSLSIADSKREFHARNRKLAAKEGLTVNAVKEKQTAERYGVTVKALREYRERLTREAQRAGLKVTDWKRAKCTELGVGINALDAYLLTNGF